MLKYLFCAGIGGLSPIFCQILGQAVIAIPGGPSKVRSVVLPLLPETIDDWIIYAVIIAAVFFIAAGVAWSSFEKDPTVTASKAFLVGVTVPALLIAGVNGINNGIQTSRLGIEAKPTTLASPSDPLSTTDRVPGGGVLPRSFEGPSTFTPSIIPISTVGLQGQERRAILRFRIECPTCNVFIASSAGVDDLNFRIDSVNGARLSNPINLKVPLNFGSDGVAIVNQEFNDSERTIDISISFSQSFLVEKTVHVSLRPGDVANLTLIVHPQSLNGLRSFFGGKSAYNVGKILVTGNPGAQRI